MSRFSGPVAPPYVRHRPERTFLYQLIEKFFSAFKAHLAAQGSSLPKHVGKEFVEFYLSNLSHWIGTCTLHRPTRALAPKPHINLTRFHRVFAVTSFAGAAFLRTASTIQWLPRPSATRAN